MIRQAEVIVKKVEQLKGARSTLDTHLQEVADWMCPRKNDWVSTQFPGNKRNYNILDNTGMVSGEMLAAALHGLLTNPASLFFELSTGDYAIDTKDSVRKWLQDTAERMHTTMNNSNFQTEVHEFYIDLVYFNTAGMTVLEDAERVVAYQTHFLKELYLCENNKGMVDEVYRVFNWEPRKIIQEFGEKNTPRPVMEAFENNRHDPWEIIHAVYPVDEYGRKEGPQGKEFTFPIVSQYILVKDKVEIAVRGFSEMPWVVSRWSKSSGEVYGRGPGMNALPEVKMVNLMEDVMIRGAQKTIDPPLQLPDDGYVLPIKTRPGGINFRRAGAGSRDGKIEPIFNDARIDFAVEMMRDRRQRIQEAFYVDQLQLAVGDRATTSEVMQKSEEKLKFLGPLAGRLQIEFLDPTVSRTFKIMERRKMFAPPPPELRNKKLEIRYSSAIAKMQKQVDAKNVFQALSLMASFFQMDPTAKDNFDVDSVVRDVSTKFSLPQKYLRDTDDRDQLRDQRAKAQAKQQQMAEEAHQADVAGKVIPAVTDAAQAAQADGIDVAE